MRTADAGRRGPWPRLQKFWDLRAACNFIGGGLGGGVLVQAAGAELLGRPSFGLALLGLGCVAFGLLMVWLEIGRPWRALNVFLHPRTSWMTREGILALPLMILGAAWVTLGFAAPGHAAIRALAPAAALVAVGFVYCQARILRAARGIPAWHHPALTPFMLLSAWAEGSGIVLIHAGPLLPLAAFAVPLALRCAAWGRYLHALQRDGAPQASRATLRLTAIVMFGADALALLAALASRHSPSAALAVIAGVLAIGSGAFAKTMLITRAAQTRGFAIPRTPVRGRGTSRPAI